MNGPRTNADLVALGKRVLDDSSHIFEGHDNARDARELLALTLAVDPAELDMDEVPPVRKRERYLALIARRAGGEPLPILMGSIEFYGLRLKVRPGPFVPRPSSELLVDRAARKLRRRTDPVVVDLCTGAGPIALALADEFPGAEVWGADIDEGALALARDNRRTHDLGNVEFRKSDLYARLPARLRGGVDVITGHIPYVPADELDDLPSEVRAYEPVHTLSDESSDGLDLIRRAVVEAPEWLRPGGWLLIELSEDLASKVLRICRGAGLEDRGAASDADELSVVVEARLPR